MSEKSFSIIESVSPLQQLSVMFPASRPEEDKEELGREEGEGEMSPSNTTSKELAKKLNVLCLWNHSRIRSSLSITAFITSFWRTPSIAKNFPKPDKRRGANMKNLLLLSINLVWIHILLPIQNAFERNLHKDYISFDKEWTTLWSEAAMNFRKSIHNSNLQTR